MNLQCKNCGKEIPWTGGVCPYCGADKTAQKREFLGCCVLGVVLVVIVLFIVGLYNLSQKNKIVGTWKLSDGTATLELAKDGKLSLLERIGGNDQVISGTYELLDGNKLSFLVRVDGKDHQPTFLVKKLTADELHLETASGIQEYKRIRP